MVVCFFLCFCRFFSIVEVVVYMFSMKRCSSGIWLFYKRYRVFRCGDVGCGVVCVWILVVGIGRWEEF